MPLHTRFCRNTLFVCLASLVAAASGGSAFAQAVNLTCGGEFHIYEPEKMDTTVNPTASAVDLASNEITTPLGTIGFRELKRTSSRSTGPPLASLTSSLTARLIG
jgi:hypothetical protein